jgi:hypothetical protein
MEADTELGDAIDAFARLGAARSRFWEMLEGATPSARAIARTPAPAARN